MKNKVWQWLMGEDQSSSAKTIFGDDVVFEGTTAEMLAKMNLSSEPSLDMREEFVDMRQYDTPSEYEVAMRGQLNLDILKMALQIETSKKQRTAFIIDVGTLPKTKAEEYIKAIAEKNIDNTIKYWIPRRSTDGNGGTEISTMPGITDVDSVLATAARLKAFIDN